MSPAPPQVPWRRLTRGSLRAEDPPRPAPSPSACVFPLSVTPHAPLPSGTQACAPGVVALMFWGQVGRKAAWSPHLLLVLESSVFGGARWLVGQGGPALAAAGCRLLLCPGSLPCPCRAQLSPQPCIWSPAEQWDRCCSTAEEGGPVGRAPTAGPLVTG